MRSSLGCFCKLLQALTVLLLCPKWDKVVSGIPAFCTERAFYVLISEVRKVDVDEQ